MELTKIAGECEEGPCPAVYATDYGTAVVQGCRVQDPQVLSRLSLPVDEGAVEIPVALLLEAAQKVTR